MRGARPERSLDGLLRRALGKPGPLRLLIACSGGPDSVALASLADRVAREDGFELILGHVDHGVRRSALQDACVVLSVGARLDRPVRIAHLGAVRDDEASLRAGRYEALAALARHAGASAVVTAHTAEDQTETVLLALFRGSGLDGLAGMRRRRPLAPGIDLVRPLLRASRAALAAELRGSGLPYAIDPTNAGSRYRRSLLRPHLDALRVEFPALDAAVARCAEILRDDLDGTGRADARRTLRERLREAGGLRDISFADIEAALDAADDVSGRDRSGPLRR